MMPSHVIADELGVDVTAALLSNNGPVVERIAQLWNTTWNLKPGRLDAKRFPSSGPYKIESVLDGGAVVLVANDRWWGAKPDHQADHRVAAGRRHPGPGQRQERYDVVDVAAGSSGTLTTPDNYDRTDAPSARHRAADLRAAGPAGGRRRRAARSRLCTPRDVIAKNAAAPIANARLQPGDRGCVSAGRGRRRGRPVHQSPTPTPRAPRSADKPLTVRIGYQSPNARLAATVGAIAKACAAGRHHRLRTSPRTPSAHRALRDSKIDVLLASTGGATGSGSTGSSAMDAYDLHTGNGNNLSGYSNGQIDGIIGALAVIGRPRRSWPGCSARAHRCCGPTCRRLPLYRQQRTLLTSKKMYAVSSNPTRWGAGWNMDRWVLVR